MVRETSSREWDIVQHSIAPTSHLEEEPILQSSVVTRSGSEKLGLVANAAADMDCSIYMIASR